MVASDARFARRALWGALCVIAVSSSLAAGCHGGGYGYGPAPFVSDRVAPMYGPNWHPARYHTYRYVQFTLRGNPPPPPPYDPMIAGSATNMAMITQVHNSLDARGYRASQKGDFDVTVYSSARPGDLDISGYTREYDWKNLPELEPRMKYPHGTVVVDVLQPGTHQLLWRGTTQTPISRDIGRYERDLRHAVGRVVDRYPKAKR